MAVIEVLCKNLKHNPHCPHGPTLRFVKIVGGSKHEFFACSAYRDRKDCSFYLAMGDKPNTEAWELEKKRVLPSVNLSALSTRLEEVTAAPNKLRLYCHTCGELDLVSRSTNHQSHDLQTGISDTLLSSPSQILKPKQGSKKEAQFWFNSSTTQVIIDNLARAGVSRVVCLGTPRIHEHITQQSTRMQSILLDMDHRYHSFWSPDKFIWFNMFNRHILGEDQAAAKIKLKEFIRVGGAGRVALVMDPPFGGHLDPLAETVRHFEKLANNHPLLVIWIFPYFREAQLLQKYPSFSMVDYKVQYENHKSFGTGIGARKLGSVVRLFTNIAASEFELPSSEGYRKCTPCNRWVAAENRHCKACNACPSKDGRTYIHCNDCERCVKPQWVHCAKCQTCMPAHHSHDQVIVGLEDPRPRHAKRAKKS